MLELLKTWLTYLFSGPLYFYYLRGDEWLPLLAEDYFCWLTVFYSFYPSPLHAFQLWWRCNIWSFYSLASKMRARKLHTFEITGRWHAFIAFTDDIFLYLYHALPPAQPRRFITHWGVIYMSYAATRHAARIGIKICLSLRHDFTRRHWCLMLLYANETILISY